MTVDLLEQPAVVEPGAPSAPADERIRCEDCGEDFPPREAEFYEPRQERLCLDCVAGELLDAEDRRAFFNYRHGS